MVDLDDNRLIELAKEGSQSAYRMLYDRYVDDLFRFVAQFRPERTEVADIVQQAFINCFTKLELFQGKSSFKTWLFSIAIREFQMDLRKWKGKETESIDDHEIPSLPGDIDLMSIKVYVSKLDERKRMVFLLFEVEGYSHKEISELLEIQESHSRTLLTRAKMELKTHLTEKRL
ncbi:sigma-70 family RNA polymerase sigma factor [bacterium]|nr:MAG: sigma-70 family RNA polymerase sigma factor [bacterium]